MKTQEPRQQQQKKSRPKQTCISEQLSHIRKNAGDLEPGEAPVPTTMLYLQGDVVELNGDVLEFPDGTPADDDPRWGTVQVNAVVVLDQVGNVMGQDSGLALLERVMADSPDAKAAEASGALATTNNRLMPQHTDGLFYDTIGGTAPSKAGRDTRMAKSFDIQVAQTLYLKNPNTRETLLYLRNRHRMTNSCITSVIGQAQPWPKSPPQNVEGTSAT